jgi:hypothetical protein
MPDLPDSTVNVTGIPVSGRFLAHTHANAVERAFMAADLFRGATMLVMPTMTQAAALARINTTYAWWANKRLGARAAVEAGLTPLVPPRVAASKANGHALAAIPALDDPMLITIARSVGVERMLAAACAAETAA